MDLFIFSSQNVTNIWAGVGARRWAVSERDESFMRGLVTRAQRMNIGSAGILYCSDGKYFTTPFLVYSPPQQDVLVTDVWPQEWVLPFRIHPLGSPEKKYPLEKPKKELPVLINAPTENAGHILRLQPTTVFVPTEVSAEDWEILLRNLSFDQ